MRDELTKKKVAHNAKKKEKKKKNGLMDFLNFQHVLKVAVRSAVTRCTES